MPKENKFLKWPVYGLFAAWGMIVLAILLMITYYLFSGSLPEFINTILGAAIFLLIVLAAIIFALSFLVGCLSALIEITGSKNDTKWKLLWGFAIISWVLGIAVSFVSDLIGVPLSLFALVVALYTLVRAREGIGRKILLLISFFLMGILPIYWFVARKDLES